MIHHDAYKICNILNSYRKGDYYRYLAEFATGDARKEAAQNSLVAYTEASKVANDELAPTHPIRLGKLNGVPD